MIDWPALLWGLFLLSMVAGGFWFLLPVALFVDAILKAILGVKDD